MKTISILFLLLLSCPSFGQSAKKWNRLLRAQCVLEQQKQDSAKSLFTKTKQQFESIQLASLDRIKSLKEAEQKVLERFMTTSELTYKLKELGVEPFPAIIADFRNRTFTGSQKFTEPIRETLNTYTVFDDGSDNLSLKGQRRKAQNRLLSKQLTKYQNRSLANSIQQQELESSRNELLAFLPRMDSLLQRYNLLSDELVTDNEQLQKKMSELEARYRKKGPKGFPDAYPKVFPGIFLSAEKLMAIRSEIQDVDYSTEAHPIAVERKSEVYEWTEEAATFPGGVEEMKTFLAKNLQTPEIVERLNISGRAYVRFVISEKGEISNVEVVRGVAGCEECDDEAIRLVKLMPNWIPGKNNGKEVKSYRALPIKFGV
jgi:TonB family protein